MSVTLEFRYNTKDMPEAIKVASKHIRRYRFRTGWNFKRLAAWLTFLVIVVIVLYLIGHRQPQNTLSAPPLPPNDSWTAMVVPLIPWVIVFTLVISLFIAQHRRLLRKLISLDDLRTLTANDDGLIWTEAAMKVEYRWHAFHGVAETPNLFVLYHIDHADRIHILVADRVQILVVPKRAFPSSAMLVEFRRLLSANARGHNGVVPVTPIKPLASPPTEQKSSPDSPIAPH